MTHAAKKVNQKPIADSKKSSRNKYEVIALVKARKDLTLSQKFIYCEIADFIRENNRTAWPSEATIAKRCGCSQKTVQRAINELEAAGVIRRVRRGGGSYKDASGAVRGRPNLYELVGFEPEAVVRPRLRVVGGTKSNQDDAKSDQDIARTTLSYEDSTESLTEDSTESISVESQSTTTETKPASPPDSSDDKEEVVVEIPIQPTDSSHGIESERLVRRATSLDAARVWVGKALAEVQGFEPEGKLPDGRYAECVLPEMLKPSWLNELKARCRRGELTYAVVAQAAESAEIPRAESKQPEQLAA